MNHYDIWCDGACQPNPGQSGSGIAIYYNKVLKELWFGNYCEKGTNNTAELTGLYKSLCMAQLLYSNTTTITIHSDSMYSIKCVKEWAKGWKANDWRKAKGEIKNLDLIKKIYAKYEELKSHIKLVHVKAHAGIEGNELADRMAVYAVDTQQSGFKRYMRFAHNDENILENVMKLRTG